MTLQQAIDKARRLARVDSTGKLDSEVMDCLNEGMKAFVKRVHDVIRHEYLQVIPKFTTSQYMGLNVEIIGGANAMAATDVYAEVARENVDGTLFATYLTTRLNAAIVAAGGAGTAVISWSTTEWKFTLDTVDGTAVNIKDPVAITYHSACSMIGASGSQTGRYFVGTMPEDCTKRVTLPTDFLALITSPEWDKDPLTQTPIDIFRSPEIFGIPTRYYIMGGELLLYPSPNRQGQLKVCFRYWPTEFVTVSGYQELGLSDRTYEVASGLSASTQYYFKVKVDSNTQVEYDITTGTDTSWGAVMALMNAEVSGATYSLMSGDIRCTSDTEGLESAIAQAPGTTGTDLFAALTGFTALETAVGPEYTTDIPLDDNYCMAIVHHVAAQLLEESFEVQLSLHHYAQFERYCGEYITTRENENTSIFPREVRKNNWEVEPFADS